MNISTQVFFGSYKTNKKAIELFSAKATMEDNRGNLHLGSACFASWQNKIKNTSTPVYYGLIIRKIDLEPLEALLKIYDSHKLSIIYSNILYIKKHTNEWGSNFKLSNKARKLSSDPTQQDGLAVLIKIVTNKELTSGGRNYTRYMLMVIIRMFCYYERFVTAHLQGKYSNKLTMKTTKLSKLKAHKFYPLEHIVEITKSRWPHDGHKLMDRYYQPPRGERTLNTSKNLTTKIVLLFNDIKFINSMGFDNLKPRQTSVLLEIMAKLKE